MGHDLNRGSKLVLWFFFPEAMVVLWVYNRMKGK